jgi:hypothetical protein
MAHSVANDAIRVVAMQRSRVLQAGRSIRPDSTVTFVGRIYTPTLDDLATDCPKIQKKA